MSGSGSAKVHRHLAAILAADVVGFSRLMGEDEEGTLAQIGEHEEVWGRLVTGWLHKVSSPTKQSRETP